MKMQSTFTLTIAKQSNTGYNNQSQLVFITKWGEVKLPYKEWNLDKIPIKHEDYTGLKLIIPSGVLESYEITSVNPVMIYDSIEGLEFTFTGLWYGTSGGLDGGMSGYATFTYDKSNTWVYESAIAVGKSNCTIAEYWERRNKLIEAWGYEEFCQKTQEAHRVFKETGFWDYGYRDEVTKALESVLA